MVAMIAFGGTYAYFTATANGVADLTAKTAKIELTSGNVASTAKVVTNNALPGEKLMDVTATLSDASTRNTYIFAVVTLKIGDTTIALTDTTTNKVFDIAWVSSDDDAITANFSEDNLVANVATGVSGVYVIENNENDNAPETVEQYNFSFTVTVKPGLDENNHNGQEDLEFMGKEVTVTVKFGAIQQKGFTYGTNGTPDGATYDYQTKEEAYKAAYSELHSIATDDGQVLDAPYTQAP